MTSLTVAELLGRADHRPWPLPRAPWAMRQSWHDLLFAHARVDAELVRAALPPQLDVDTFDGEAWLGVVPFRMSGVRPRCLPPIPTASAFPELNLRTYVRHRGAPGVWFFTLEASSALAVRGARRAFHLPYHLARMRCEAHGESLRYESERIHRGAAPAELAAEYGPIGNVFHARERTLEHWLTERYCLFASRGRAVLRADVHHAPWPLQPARARIERNTLPDAHALRGGRELAFDHLLFARRLDVLVWMPRRVE